MHSSLEDIRILDFSHALAGPFCTLLLSHYGATVYKLEPPEGEIGRGWGPPFTGGEASYFLGLNAGKFGLSIDLKRPGAAELCLRLIEKADVLVENFRPGAMDRLGLGYNAAQERNPKLIYCSISGYGQDGPQRDHPAMDLIMQASCGLISITGAEGGETVRCGHSVADVTAGMFAAIGILMALRTRDRSGAGQHIDVSMLDSMISAMASNFAYFAGSGELPRPMGTTFATIVPYRTFAAVDRDIAIAVGSERLWLVFCEAIGRPDLAAHPDYSVNSLRVKNRAALEPLLAAIFRAAGSAEWIARLGAVGVPCSPVRTLREVFEDPLAAARGMFPAVGHPAAGPFPVTGPPVKMPASPGGVRRPAPMLGQHNREALSSLLGLDEAALDDLRAGGVIA